MTKKPNPTCPKCKQPTTFLEAFEANKKEKTVTVKVYKCYEDNILVTSELKSKSSDLI